jgi:anaerobic ribonucleoside-triphosphate reductase activating protein
VVFFQGCPFDCPGCFNPETHPFESRELTTPSDILKKHFDGALGLEGITISGGEPFMQPRALAELLRIAKADYNLTTLVYTGFTIDELRRRPDALDALRHIDVLVDGRFNEGLREETLLARGSANQRFIFLTDRYSEADLVMPARVEIVIRPDGKVVATGFSNLLIPC